ncbi:hypothetical protein J1N35_006363 [Gossypium stocksii]|uniref:Uncharacterized protein n=1 Tax=Gossypium stocksii TaxID=47602 RepID=A0A9D3WH40_9ROSI|nr:hypothetical protein J1N35_006363 [Gossypium stocksii]
MQINHETGEKEFKANEMIIQADAKDDFSNVRNYIYMISFFPKFYSYIHTYIYIYMAIFFGLFGGAVDWSRKVL